MSQWLAGGDLAAAACAAGAVALLLPPPRRRLLQRRLRGSVRFSSPQPDQGRRQQESSRSPAWLIAGFVSLVLGWWQGAVAGLAALGVAAAVVHAWRSRAIDREVDARRSLVVEACLALAADLRGGQSPPVALQAAAEIAPDAFAGPARQAALGGDVARALRQRSTVRGHEALSAAAAGWVVCEQTGAPLADVLSRVVANVRSEAAVRAETEAQLGSVRATARLLAVLPVFTLLMAAGAGGSPLHFLTATPVGVACLLSGGLLIWAGVAWVDRLARSAVG